MGLEDFRFTGHVDEDYRCSICQDIIEDPIASQCEHVFCKICIYQWLQRESSCPVDRKPLNISQLCKPSRFFRNPYSKLVLKCVFQSNGCENNCKIEDLISHQNKCEFNPIIKIECEKGCEAILTRNELISHNCIQYLKSKNRKDLVKAKNRQSEHEELIKDLQTMVSTKCDEINVLEQRIDSLMSSSSNLICTRLASLNSNSQTNSVNYHKMSWNEDKHRFLSMETEEKRKYYKCGNNFKTLSNIKTWDEYSKLNNIQNKFSNSDYRFNNEINRKVSIFIGDITALEIDAIVNAANQGLRGGGEVNGAIRSAADRKLLQTECQSLNGCETGNCKITGGYKLPAKYVIHAVGPVGIKPALLQGCYRNALELLSENKLKSIAFPCISTGIIGYPNEAAAHVALRSVRNWLDGSQYSKQVDRVIFCLFLQKNIQIYNKLMSNYFPLQ